MRWSNGGSATVRAADKVHVTLESDRPFAPGTPAPGTLDQDGEHAFVLKVATSRKVGDVRWEVRGRLVTATREVLAAFVRAVSAPSEK